MLQKFSYFAVCCLMFLVQHAESEDRPNRDVSLGGRLVFVKEDAESEKVPK